MDICRADAWVGWANCLEGEGHQIWTSVAGKDKWNVEVIEVRGAPDEGVGQVEVAALARSLLACRQLLWAEAVAL